MSSNVNRKKTSTELSACKEIMKKLFSRPYKRLAWIFYDPLDPDLLQLPDYHEIVKEPMDLNTVKFRLWSGLYQNALEFAKDMRLIFYNTYLYTNPGHVCYDMAKKLQLIFEDMYAQVPLNGNICVASDAEDELDEIQSVSSYVDSTGPAEQYQSDETSSLYSADTWSKSKSPSLHDCGENEDPLTAEEDLDLHATIQQVDGEILLNVIHMIHQMENVNNAKYSNKELEFDVSKLKTHTKRSILIYMESKGIAIGKRMARQTTKNQ